MLQKYKIVLVANKKEAWVDVNFQTETHIKNHGILCWQNDEDFVLENVLYDPSQVTEMRIYNFGNNGNLSTVQMADIATTVKQMCPKASLSIIEQYPEYSYTLDLATRRNWRVSKFKLIVNNMGLYDAFIRAIPKTLDIDAISIAFAKDAKLPIEDKIFLFREPSSIHVTTSIQSWTISSLSSNLRSIKMGCVNLNFDEFVNCLLKSNVDSIDYSTNRALTRSDVGGLLTHTKLKKLLLNGRCTADDAGYFIQCIAISKLETCSLTLSGFKNQNNRLLEKELAMLIRSRALVSFVYNVGGEWDWVKSMFMKSLYVFRFGVFCINKVDYCDDVDFKARKTLLYLIGSYNGPLSRMSPQQCCSVVKYMY